MEIVDENIVVDFSEEDDLLPFSGNIKDSFYKIEHILDENNLSSSKLLVLKNTMEVVDYLVGLGNVQEQLVIDTALVYILLKHVDVNEKILVDYFNKFVISGAFDMVKNIDNFEFNSKLVFENRDHLYLSKIKVADYIFELKSFDNENDMRKSSIYRQVKIIIERYRTNLQKDLLNELLSIVE